jgi:cobaltochelatase CobS
MTTEIRDKTRNALVDRIMKVNHARDIETTSSEEPAKPEPEKLFNSDAKSEAKVGAIMYSDTFEGAKAWLKQTGRPDIDISALVWERSDWDADDQAMIPELDPHYIWQHDALYAVVQGQTMQLKSMLVGDTGTGKSKLHENLAAVYNQPFYRLNGRGDMESDTILGRVDIENGSTTFLLGEFTKRFVKGYYILLDEPWKLPASINMALQRPLEHGGILQIDDMKGDLADKQFKPHPRLQLNLADNVVGTGDDDGRWAGTNIQDHSTLNRVDMVVRLNYLPADQEAAMLEARFPEVTHRQAVRAVQLANLIREGVSEGALTVTMSPRNLMAWMKLAIKARSYEHGFIYTMLNRYAEQNERDTVINFWSTVYGSPLV